MKVSVPTLEQTLGKLLALPREAGTPAASEARAIVTQHLEALGYRVTPQPFTFNPAALDAFPLFGAALGWLALVVTPLLVTVRVPGWLPLVLWILGLLAAAMMAIGTGLGWFSISRDQVTRTDANLIATRADVPIRRWIVAHLDTKAQRQSMAGRLVAVWCVIVAILVFSSLAAVRIWAPVSLVAAMPGAVLLLVAGLLAGRGRLRGTSAGARDNGTGLAAALAAAATATDPAIGILITGAEEFGLVGARIVAQQMPERLRGVEVVNIDTVDDDGILTLITHDAAGHRLGGRLMPVLAPLDIPLRTRRLPLGIFVDSVPLAQAGAEAVTIGRLTWRTLRKLHTPADTPDGLSFEPAIAIGRRIATDIATN